MVLSFDQFKTHGGGRFEVLTEKKLLVGAGKEQQQCCSFPMSTDIKKPTSRVGMELEPGLEPGYFVYETKIIASYIIRAKSFCCIYLHG